MSREAGDREFVEGLARGMAVIESFDETHAEMTLSEVAKRTGMTPSTARRSLHTLVRLGYVQIVERRFLLSARILALGSAYLRSAHVDEVFFPELRQIVAQTGHSSSVSILVGADILYIANYSEERGVRPIARIGVTYPAFATSMGRVLLASRSDAELDAYFATSQFRKLTAVTETEPKKLRRLILDARKYGYSTAVDQLADGVTAIAVPIRTARGEVIAALNISGYSGRVTPKELAGRLGSLQEAAKRLAAMIERHPALLHSLSNSLSEPASQSRG